RPRARAAGAPRGGDARRGGRGHGGAEPAPLGDLPPRGAGVLPDRAPADRAAGAAGPARDRRARGRPRGGAGGGGARGGGGEGGGGRGGGRGRARAAGGGDRARRAGGGHG